MNTPLKNTKLSAQIAVPELHPIRRLIKLIVPVFQGEARWHAWGLLGLLLLLLTAIKGFDVVMSYIGRDFMTALSVRDRDTFIRELYFYLGAFAVATPLAVFYRYTEERLALFWRRWFSQRVLHKYFHRRAYYRLSWYQGIDNPDQRIEEDVRSFTATSLSLFLIFLQSGIALVAFTGVLSSISWRLTAAAFLYAGIGSIATYFLGRPLISLNFEQLKREANYRYKLVRVRDNAESIAFIGGEARELTRTRQRLKEVIRNLLRIIRRNRLLNFFTTGYNFFTIILPTIVVAPLYLDGKIEFGVVTQAAVAFSHVLNALSVIIQNFGSLSSYAAVVRRLGAFTEALDMAAQEGETLSECVTIHEGKELAFSNVSIVTPTRSRTLLKDFNFSMAKGGLLIRGPSGSGKSSLLRVVGGLWSAGSGTITRPNLESCAFVPQRPYLPIGTLRHQLLYNQQRTGVTDTELLEILKLVELREMFERVGGFGAEVDFAATLSNGEQQRIGVARALLAGSPYVFLDEATTAVEEAGEARLYDLLRERAVLLVSVGHREHLARYHDYYLDLLGDGRWNITAAGGRSRV